MCFEVRNLYLSTAMVTKKMLLPVIFFVSMVITTSASGNFPGAVFDGRAIYAPYQPYQLYNYFPNPNLDNLLNFFNYGGYEESHSHRGWQGGGGVFRPGYYPPPPPPPPPPQRSPHRPTQGYDPAHEEAYNKYRDYFYRRFGNNYLG